MKFIVSSATLAKKLNELNDRVDKIQIGGNTLNLFAGTKSVWLEVHGRPDQGELNQDNVRWDWIKETVNQISDQPVVMNIDHNDAIMSLNF